MVWAEDRVNALDLRLDPENPRIEVDAAASQADIRGALIDHEQVLELAADIAASEGNFAGERVIVLGQSSGGYLVLEGNRRVCACQL
jgi:alpha-beta hydrolase superfamily lysophospholipase